MKKFLLSLATLVLLAGCRSTIHEADYPASIRVACVGDSITYGLGISDREHNSYPAQLQGLLGSHWQVRNFGFNGATALKNSPKPYLLLPVCLDALSFEPDVVIIQLGTNDTNPKSWPAHREEFIADYLEIIRRFQKLATKPRIYLCRPVPLFRDRGKDYDTDKILIEEVIPKINTIARKNRLPVIDLYVALENKSTMFPDGVHPDANGAHLMAAAISKSLIGRASSSPQSASQSRL